MRIYEINVGSITYALKAQKLLEGYRIVAQVERNAELSPGKGCGYKIVANCNINDVLTLLKNANIPVKGVAVRG